ncbi:MAG: reprolysin-like metallopeptidase [Pseudomonadota bacterium]
MADRPKPDPFSLKTRKDRAEAEAPYVHIYCGGAVCVTDDRGAATPRARSPVELVVDASNGFIPLWDRDVTLRWRFQERSLTAFRRPDAAKEYLRELLGEGVLLWGDAQPVRFAEVRDGWDFEFVARPSARCSENGCVLASAFFPDGGQHELVVYPTLFEQSREEQVETMAHEVGHIFGLRHFFAQISETAWPSRIFGDHSPFSIMNYGPDSRMTERDQEDLKELYRLAWTGEMTEINGTPIRLVRAFSDLREPRPQIALAAATKPSPVEECWAGRPKACGPKGA